MCSCGGASRRHIAKHRTRSPIVTKLEPLLVADKLQNICLEALLGQLARGAWWCRCWTTTTARPAEAAIVLAAIRPSMCPVAIALIMAARSHLLRPWTQAVRVTTSMIGVHLPCHLDLLTLFPLRVRNIGPFRIAITCIGSIGCVARIIGAGNVLRMTGVRPTAIWVATIVSTR